MRIAVIGASGNVGSALLRRLARDGEHELVGVARRPPDGAEPPFDQTSWVAADVADPDPERLVEALQGADAVVNLAWGFQPSHDEQYLEAVGVGGTRRVLEAASRAGVPHVVHMSSVGAYSPRRDLTPVDESWPTGGVPTSPYSRHKAAAERLLDSFEAERPSTVVSRMRPGIVGQRRAGSSLLRYSLPAAVPAAVLGAVPVLPLDRRLVVPVVHADDVADAFARVLASRTPGAFNLAADPPLTVEDIAGALSARHVHVPAAVVRAAVAGSWHARLQPIDPGWIDLAYQVPMLDTDRARRVLGWTPDVDARSVIEETVAGMRAAAHDATATLRPRTVGRQLTDFVRSGPVTRRRRP